LGNFIDDMICPKETIKQGFLDRSVFPSMRESLLSSPYWPVAFQMFFCEPLLLAMFGPDAIQHAPKGTYPIHFQNALTKGLRRDDAFDNYFLHHILLGYYLDRETAQPEYLSKTPIKSSFTLIHGTLQEVSSFSDFDLIHLSNVFDWMSEDDIIQITKRLSEEMRKGACVVLRQLNHDTDFSRFFGPSFRFEHQLEQTLHSKDRSLFYSKLNIGICQ